MAGEEEIWLANRLFAARIVLPRERSLRNLSSADLEGLCSPVKFQEASAKGRGEGAEMTPKWFLIERNRDPRTKYELGNTAQNVLLYDRL